MPECYLNARSADRFDYHGVPFMVVRMRRNGAYHGKYTVLLDARDKVCVSVETRVPKSFYDGPGNPMTKLDWIEALAQGFADEAELLDKLEEVKGVIAQASGA